MKVVTIAVCLWSLAVLGGLLLIGLLDVDYWSPTAMLARCIAWTPCALWIDWHSYNKAPSVISFQIWGALFGAGVLTWLVLPYRVSVQDPAAAALVREALLALAGVAVPATVPLLGKPISQLRRTSNTVSQVGEAQNE